jgi:hypothetical protein
VTGKLKRCFERVRLFHLKSVNLFLVWDAPQVDFSVAESAIVMFDFILASSYRKALTWYEAVVQRYPNFPVVLVGNKVKIRNKQV